MKMPTTTAGGRKQTSARRQRSSGSVRSNKSGRSLPKQNHSRTAAPIGGLGRVRRKTKATAQTKAGRDARAATKSRRGSGSAEATTDHGTIRDWVEARGGFPATVKGTARGDQHAGLLRIDFPGFSGERSLEHVEWDEWFEKFDESKLTFLCQAKTSDGEESRFFKLVRRRK